MLLRKRPIKKILPKNTKPEFIRVHSGEYNFAYRDYDVSRKYAKIYILYKFTKWQCQLIHMSKNYRAVNVISFLMVSLTGSHSVGKIPDRISTNGLQVLTCAYSSWVVRHVTMCASWFFFSTMYNPIKLWSEMIFINFRLCIRNLPKLQHVSITIFYQCGRR